LKDALGLRTLDGTPRRVPLGRDGGHLDALLLDVKQTFDDLVRGLATTPEQAERVLQNRLYQNLSGTLTGTAEYMAVETVYRLATEDHYDLLIVDTPPAQHAADFLDAPRRLLALLDSRVFAILKDPASILPGASSKLAQMILTGVIGGLERFTGLGLMSEIGGFIRAIESLSVNFRTRVAGVSGLLHADETALLLVTAPEPRLTTETTAMVQTLRDMGHTIAGVVVNRALPQATFARRTPGPAALLDTPPELLRRLIASWDDISTWAGRQASTLEPLLRAADAPLLAEVPFLPSAPATIEELIALARHLVPPGVDTTAASG
jgi:anion-transporting  ArsA/GET3 family ATPase